MLSPAIWKERALRDKLTLGMRRRYPHDCGAGDVVLVNAEADGLHAYCFRCDDAAVVPRAMSIKEQVAALNAKKSSEDEFRAGKLPSDYTLDIPEHHALWLYKASIRKAQARELGIGWSPSMQRIILPVYDRAKNLAFVQARAVNKGQQPKYLNSKGSAAGSTLFMTSTINAGTEFVIITEDMLSAIRCGRYGAACALCGVSVNDYKIHNILEAKTLMVWLDPDPAGQKGMRKFIKWVSLLHNDVRLIHSLKDPKFLTDAQIRRHIDDCRANGGTTEGV
jgi:DNA primase